MRRYEGWGAELGLIDRFGRLERWLCRACGLMWTRARLRGR
jgi:hypothetical protein